MRIHLEPKKVPLHFMVQAGVRGRSLGLALLLACAASLAPSTAAAIPYFNEPFGFDNSTLQLDLDYVIPLDAVFPYIASNDPSLDLVLLSEDQVDDTATTIDRLITWTLINTVPEEIGEFLVFFTAVVPGDTDYSGAVIDIDMTGTDEMVIAGYGPYTFLGFILSPDDFVDMNGELTAVRQFRYTVDEAQQAGGPPDLGIAYVQGPIVVPEPGTGLLLASAIGIAAAAARRLNRCV